MTVLFFLLLAMFGQADTEVIRPAMEACGDFQGDGDRDLADWADLQNCFAHLDAVAPCCAVFDSDSDCNIDGGDVRAIAETLGGPAVPPSVAYHFYGINLSAFVNGQNPDQGAVVDPCQVGQRLRVVSPFTDWIRIFGMTNGHQEALLIARELGHQTAAQAWIGRNAARNQVEINALIAWAQAGYVDLAIVGSETLLRHDVTPEILIGYIQQVQKALPNIPVTTADVYGELLAHPTVMEACDVIMVNYYPYWEGASVDFALAKLHRDHADVVAAAGGKPVIVGETGWPTCGNTIGCAVPSPQNAAFYSLNFVSWARANQVAYFYFSAFDELWHIVNEGPQGACWGIFEECGARKREFDPVFEGVTMSDNWTSVPIPGGPGEPDIEFTFVPALGERTNEWACGRVLHLDPLAYKLAFYILVPPNGWWTKPTFAAPLTTIGLDGCFAVDTQTGGHDYDASVIRAYVLPIGYDPPLCGGCGSLPAVLHTEAVYWEDYFPSPP